MAVSKKKYGYNAEPRLSVNQLSEYIDAGVNRRKGIVRDAKYPKKSVVARYEGAWEGITKFLCNNGRPMADLVDAMEIQKAREKKPGASTWVQQDARLSIEAIDQFRKSYNKLGLAKFSCRPVALNAPKLNIQGIDVSVALDATTHRKDEDDQDRVGGLVMVFSKSEASSAAREKRCRVAAVLTALFVEEHIKNRGLADPKLCFSLDVFAGNIYRTPASYVKRLGKIQGSCEEVSLWWPTINPPDDYDGPGS